MVEIKKIYGNGCSFIADTIPRDTAPPGYLEMLAHDFGWEYHNAGKPGSCNRRIIRSTLRDSINLDSQCLVLLQLTWLHRTERPAQKNGFNDWKFDMQDFFVGVKPLNHQELEPEEAEFAKQHVLHYDPLAAMTNLTSDLLMLTSYLKHRQIPYLCFAYLPLLDPGQSRTIENNLLDYELAKDPCVINMLSDSLISHMGPGDWYYDADGNKDEIGHFNSHGHRTAASVIKNLLINRFGAPK